MRAVSAHKSYEWNNDFRNFSFRKTGFILVIINFIYQYFLQFIFPAVRTDGHAVKIILLLASYGKKSSSNFSFLKQNNENIFAYGLSSGSVAVFGNVQEVGAKANVTNVPGHCHAFTVIIELKFFGPWRTFSSWLVLCRSTTIACLSRSI